MDVLLRGDAFRFTIDEIFFMEKNIFGASLIPDINSTYFPPWHLRNFYFDSSFLSKDFYESFRTKLAELPDPNTIEFQSSIEQGQFYELSTDFFNNGTTKKIPREPLPQSSHDIFAQSKSENPYTDISNNSDEILDMQSGLEILTDTLYKDKNFYIYCFNVGQGDSLLLIFPNDNVYIIDTNIYSDNGHFNNLNQYIYNLKRILKIHKLSSKRIKSLIITHKHVDHLRGAKKLIESGEFYFENFIINYDYRHCNKIVEELIKCTDKNIKVKINMNNTGKFQEGKVQIKINNPGINMKNEIICKDINDSSISFVIKYGSSTVALTGDTGYPILNRSYSSKMFLQGDNILKVSHHGSRTGTDKLLLYKLKPKFAFISAGNHRGFGHPHEEVTDELDKKKIRYDISKNIKKIVRYKVSSTKITKEYY